MSLRRAPLRVAAAGVAMLALVACTPGAPSSPTSLALATAPTGLRPDHALVRVDQRSGWPQFALVDDPRTATLYADGTLIGRDPARASLMLPISITRLDPQALDRAWGTVTGAGLAVDRAFDLPGLYDAGSTAITIDDGTRRTELSIYALGAGDGVGASFRPDEAALRMNASRVIGLLGGMVGSTPYTPPALLLFWSPFEAEASGQAPRVVAWSAPVDLATDGSPFENPVWSRCLRLEGPDADAVARVIRTLPPDIVVEQGHVQYAVAARAILPEDLGTVDCP